jgi:hypothetical protein
MGSVTGVGQNRLAQAFADRQTTTSQRFNRGIASNPQANSLGRGNHATSRRGRSLVSDGDQMNQPKGLPTVREHPPNRSGDARI